MQYTHIYIWYTHSTYMVAQPGCRAVVIIGRLVWFLLSSALFFFTVYAFFILVLVTEAEQYLPMWRFYRVKARKSLQKLLPCKHFLFVCFFICLMLKGRSLVLHWGAQTLSPCEVCLVTIVTKEPLDVLDMLQGWTSVTRTDLLCVANSS